MKPCVILTRPSFEGNVGSVARAMQNMGLSELRIVSPLCDPLGDEALRMAVHAKSLLAEAPLFSSLAEALSDCQAAYGFSARTRGSPIREIGLPECAREVSASGRAKVALVFGNEQSGLSNEEITLCSARVYIPSSDAYPVLNLAQAVQVAAYACFEASSVPELQEDGPLMQWERWHKESALLPSVHRIADELLRLMEETGFYDGRQSAKPLSRDKFRRIFVGAHLSQGEADLMLGFLERMSALLIQVQGAALTKGESSLK